MTDLDTTPANGTSTSTDDTKLLNTNLYLLPGVVLFITVGVAYLVWFVLTLKTPLSVDTGDWGSFGDFIGGVTNPVIALLALSGLLQTIRLQQREFRDVTQAMKEQNDKLEQQLLQHQLQNLKSDYIKVFDDLLHEVKKKMDQPFGLDYGFTIDGINQDFKSLTDIQNRVERVTELKKLALIRLKVVNTEAENNAANLVLTLNEADQLCGQINRNEELNNEKLIQHYANRFQFTVAFLERVNLITPNQYGHFSELRKGLF